MKNAAKQLKERLREKKAKAVEFNARFDKLQQSKVSSTPKPVQ
jgi:hypothetical protein